MHAVIPAIKRLRQEDNELEVSLGYKARPPLNIGLYVGYPLHSKSTVLV